MKNSKKETLFAIFITFILMTSAISMTLIQSAQAQLSETQPVSGELPDGVTPSITISPIAYLSFRPNPVGVDQTVLVNIWLTPATNVHRFHQDYKITITDPDGNEEEITMDSYCADSTAWFEFTPDQTGNWTLKFEFPGEYYPAGQYYNGYIVTNSSGNYIGSTYYEPDSTQEQILVVQEAQVVSWPASPLPTDYWTRPISPENREWWSIAGNYPASGIVGGGSTWPEDTNTYISNYDYVPYVQAPNTAHVVWTRQTTISGLVGGAAGIKSLTSSGSTPSVIYSGRCYQTVSKQGVGNVAQCYDLRTGEIYYEIPISAGGVTPQYISYSTSTSLSVPGATESLSESVTLFAVSNGRLIKIDPWTGLVTLNVTAMAIAGAGTGTSSQAPSSFYKDPYCLSIQTINATAGIYRLINWTVAGTTTNFNGRIMSNVSFPVARTSLPFAVDFETGIAVQPYFIQDSRTGAWTGTTITAWTLETGNVLWNITVDDTVYCPYTTVADHGKVAVLMMNGYWMCYDQYTGKVLWKSELMDYPWSQPSFGAYECSSAYGLLYRMAYDGVYAFDWDTGEIVWKYTAPTPYEYETPYTDENGTGVYSFNGGAIIADGKIYTYNTEHTATQPIARGWSLHCIDAITGEGIWNITGSMNPGAIADGYLTAGNSYDGYMYVFGKGQSETTISAPQIAITSGNSAIISGTVLDMSSAQEGTACVSAGSMADWMEYLHMQHSIPNDVIGVPVSIDAVDPNGNYVHIADVTSDMSGTFSYTWTPDIVGDYTITATFMGDDSYGSSWAETHATVAAASAASPTPTPVSFDAINSNVTTTIMVGVIAIIVAVAVVGLLVLRKK